MPAWPRRPHHASDLDTVLGSTIDDSDRAKGDRCQCTPPGRADRFDQIFNEACRCPIWLGQRSMDRQASSVTLQEADVARRLPRGGPAAGHERPPVEGR
jgi:hypothetical protein